MSNVTPTGSDHSPLILIANDQEWTARAVESILESSGYRVAHAYTARDVLSLAASCDPDLVILDQQLPDFSGTEVCRELRADPRFGALLPIIITTAGPSGRPQRLNAYAAGAWEFYGQPLDAEALLQKIGVYLSAYQETRRLRRCVMVDDTTGLYSRLGLAKRATELIGEARRVGRAFACIAWSVPGLESVAAMGSIATAFRSQGRVTDALAQLGESTLALVAPGASSTDASRLADRMGRVIANAAGITADRIRATIVSAEDPDLLPSDGDQLLDQVTLALAS